VSLLEVAGLRVMYGAIEAVRDASFTVEEGEVVTLIGANGAGKTSTLMALSGVVRPRAGTLRFDGIDLARAPAHRVVAAGLVQVPEGREVFARMTVRENLMLGAAARRDARAVDQEIRAQLDRFPALARRRDQPAGLLSGGEQQMLAIARALLARPRLLMLDEPSLGLAPQLVDEVFDIIAGLKRDGHTILLIEQNALRALEGADRGYVMETGRTTLSGSASALLHDPDVRRAYLGV